ncbi:MAG: amino acid ABC transporter ATP-binding protein [Nitrospiraceae bacterium]|nr:MAG: amino acid ABC transporter ATP-binding protein [Nitrospiraceae bacterium]
MVERIEGRNLRKRYNSVFDLSCSLDLEKGVFHAIVGPNGSGKSTLLRMLGLLERPDSGDVIYHDAGTPLLNPWHDRNARRKAVLVPTRARHFNESVYDNAAYGLKLRKIPKAEVRERVLKALRDVGLEGKEGLHAGGLSSGEAQRLAIARALAINPDVLLLDEPTASLDPSHTKTIESIIQKRKESFPGVMAMVTHSLFQARALADTVIFLYEGRIVETSAPADFFDRPSTEAARRFVAGEVY